MSPEQLRSARACLGMSVNEIAQLCGVSRLTVFRIERGEISKGQAKETMRRVLEEAGIVFLDEGEISPAPAAVLPKQTHG